MKCNTCWRDPEQVNSSVSECSHIDCPHRRKAWSERPTATELSRGPWPTKTKDADPLPLDKAIGGASGVDLKATLAMTDRELQGAANALARRIAQGNSVISDAMVVIELANRMQRASVRGAAS